MSDRQLLMAAARAAGLRHKWKADRDCVGVYHRDTINNVTYWLDWNPRNDDGEAFQLAVRLQIDICLNNGVAEAIWVDMDRSETHSIEVPCDEAFEGLEAKYAATRLAIVRMAALIGEKMKGSAP